MNVPAQTYTVYVTPAGGTTTLVGQNYAFRTGANPLNNLTLYAAAGSNLNVQLQPQQPVTISSCLDPRLLFPASASQVEVAIFIGTEPP